MPIIIIIIIIILLHKLNEQKRAFSNVYKLAAAVATFGCSVAICQCSFFALSRIDTSPASVLYDSPAVTLSCTASF